MKAQFAGEEIQLKLGFLQIVTKIDWFVGNRFRGLEEEIKTVDMTWILCFYMHRGERLEIGMVAACTGLVLSDWRR